MVEQLKAAMVRAFADRSCANADVVVAHGPQSAITHQPGSGEIQPGEPVVIDIASCDLGHEAGLVNHDDLIFGPSSTGGSSDAT
jgi:hypothetical protein